MNRQYPEHAVTNYIMFSSIDEHPYEIVQMGGKVTMSKTIALDIGGFYHSVFG